MNKSLAKTFLCPQQGSGMWVEPKRPHGQDKKQMDKDIRVGQESWHRQTEAIEVKWRMPGFWGSDSNRLS
jgi:hypothetical protein